MTFRFRTYGTAALLLLGCLSGCAAPEPTAPELRLPQRILVFAPSAAEMLAALGLEDRVVGIGSHGPWPAALEGLESVGSFDRPNIERTLELEVDLVLTTASVAANEAYMSLGSLGVRVEPLDTSTFDGIFASLARLGSLFDVTELADELAAQMQAELDRIRDATAGLARRKVLVVVGRDPLYVAGPGSHLDELIEIAGGINVAHDAAAPYQQFSFETILEREPDVIVDTSGTIEHWSRWPFIPAVRDERVYAVPPSELAIPGMRLTQMARAMARLIHPEQFPSGTEG